MEVSGANTYPEVLEGLEAPDDKGSVMMKWIAGVLMMHGLAYADDCSRGMREIDSQVMMIKELDLPFHYEFPLDQAKFAVKEMVRKQCGDTKLKIDYAHCREIEVKNPFSNACYVETHRGYFMVSFDVMGNAWVMWSRWD
jgi:hypothetical protein